jgi:hypothetical protein
VRIMNLGLFREQALDLKIVTLVAVMSEPFA